MCSSADAGTPALFPSGEAQESQEWHWQTRKQGRASRPPRAVDCWVVCSGAETGRRWAGGLAMAMFDDEWAS